MFSAITAANYGDPEPAVLKLAGDNAENLLVKLPDYAFDCHTLKDRQKGKTKADFFREEQKASKLFQPGLFDALPGT
jgi:hypothetical protein